VVESVFMRMNAATPPTTDHGWLNLRVKFMPAARLRNWSPRSVKVGSSVKAPPPRAGIAIEERPVALATLVS